MITIKQVEKAIKDKTGLAAQLHRFPEGYYCFYSNLDEKLDLLLASKQSASVYVYRLNCQSIDRWVADFERIIKGN